MAGPQQFGQVVIQANEVFFRTRLSVAFVNLKPVAPGHVLVVPRRVVLRFSELTGEEVGDLYGAVQRVGVGIEQAYKGAALSIVMQDGAAAGQTIHHVHVHVIPRHKGDWPNNDDIYDDVDKSSQHYFTAIGKSETERQARTRAEMSEEASFLRTLFPDSLSS